MNYKLFFTYLSAGILVIIPFIVSAKSITEIIDMITKDVINPTIILLFALATVMFVWGIVQYIAAAGSAQQMEKGKKIMIGGIIGLFVMASAYGIVQILCDFFESCTSAK